MKRTVQAQEQSQRPRVSLVPVGPRVSRWRSWLGWERTVVLAGAVGLALAFFLAIEPTQPWLLVLALVLAGLGTDGIVRSHPSLQQAGPADTAAYLFIPVLFVLAAGLFLEHSTAGYWSWVAAAAATPLFAALVYWEYVTVNPASPLYPSARFFLNAGTYLVAFALFAFSYEFEVAVLPSALVVGAVSFLLAVEILREGWMAPLRTLTYAGAIAVVMAEARGLLLYLPLDGFLASVFLLLAFYLATGLVLHYFRGDFRWATVAEFVSVGSAGLALLALGSWFQG